MLVPIRKSQAVRDNAYLPPPVGAGRNEPLRLLMCVENDENDENDISADAVPARSYNHYVPLIKKKVQVKSKTKKREKRGKQEEPAVVDPLAGVEGAASDGCCTIPNAATFFSRTVGRQVSKTLQNHHMMYH